MRDGSTSILGAGGAPTTKGPVAGAPKKAGKAKQPPAAEIPPTKWFRVLEAKDVPRHGGSYHLHAGKEISSAGYDIASLTRAGVKMEPLEAPPAWWLERQHQAVADLEADEDLADEKPREQLAARGIPSLLEQAPPPAA